MKQKRESTEALQKETLNEVEEILHIAMREHIVWHLKRNVLFQSLHKFINFKWQTDLGEYKQDTGKKES